MLRALARPSAWIPAIALSAVASAAAQDTTTYEAMVHTIVDDVWVDDFSENDPSLLVGTATAPTGTAIATAQLGLGVNKVSARFESLDANNPAGMLVAGADTTWYDEVTISDPELNGTLGTFTASLRVEGNDDFALDGAYLGSPFANVYGFWSAYIGTTNSWGSGLLVQGWSGSWYSDGDETGVYYIGDDLNQPLTEVELEFIYGEPFILAGLLSAYVDAENSELEAGTVSATLDFSNSAYWNGISGIYDANGNLVSDFTLTSASGTDWTQPVAAPEPTGLAALAAGGATLLLRRAGRRSRR